VTLACNGAAPASIQFATSINSAVTDKAIDLAVTGIGMVSALGLSAATSCAAARAGLSRAAPLDEFKVYSEGDWSYVGVVGHSVRRYADGFRGLGKLARLASGALADLQKDAPLTAEDWSRTAMLVALPSSYFQSALASQLATEEASESGLNGEQASLNESLIDRACKLANLPGAPHGRLLEFDDQAGFVRLLQRAARLLQSGEFDRCVVGGVDACTDEAYLAAAHHFHAVKAGDQAAGFQPGEAAAFLLMENTSGAMSRGARIQTCVTASAYGRDETDRTSGKPAVGVGLSDVLRNCLLQLGDKARHIGWMIVDLNGDAFRANDWGYALVRLAASHPHIGLVPVWIPPESFGEVGAASGPVAICVAVRSHVRGYAPARSALLPLSSYSGSRGAFTLSFP